jgi:hypothetical protein
MICTTPEGFAGMYLSTERIAVANKAVKETFEQTSIAWQAIPHWDTGDPAQTKVRLDKAYAPRNDPAPLGEDPVPILTFAHNFYLTVAQAIAPAPDALLAAVIARTVYLAKDVDGEVIDKLLANAHPTPGDVRPPPPGSAATAVSNQIAKILNGLIDARSTVEDAGYRSPSCLLTNTVGLKALTQLDAGYSELDPLLDAANANSRYRVEQLADGDKGKLLLLGRRQRIAHGGAAAASPGEEPVDLAISSPPSLEVIGETKVGYIEFAVRIRFATRITDGYGIVGVVI